MEQHEDDCLQESLSDVTQNGSDSWLLFGVADSIRLFTSRSTSLSSRICRKGLYPSFCSKLRDLTRRYHTHDLFGYVKHRLVFMNLLLPGPSIFDLTKPLVLDAPNPPTTKILRYRLCLWASSPSFTCLVKRMFSF